MNEPPLPFRTHRVRVLAAEEPDAVGFHQFLDGGGVKRELKTEQGDGACVLCSSENKLLFPLALPRRINAWQRSRQGDEQKGGRHHDDQQGIAAIPASSSREKSRDPT